MKKFWCCGSTVGVEQPLPQNTETKSSDLRIIPDGRQDTDSKKKKPAKHIIRINTKQSDDLVLQEYDFRSINVSNVSLGDCRNDGSQLAMNTNRQSVSASSASTNASQNTKLFVMKKSSSADLTELPGARRHTVIHVARNGARVHKRESDSNPGPTNVSVVVPAPSVPTLMPIRVTRVHSMTHIPEIDIISPLSIPPRPYPEEEIKRLAIRHGMVEKHHLEANPSSSSSDVYTSCENFSQGMKSSGSNIMCKSNSDDPLVPDKEKREPGEGKIRLRYDDIMATPEIRDTFINFCIERMCLENIMFLEHYMELKNLREYIRIQEKVSIMYFMFLADDATFLINTNDTKRAIVKTILDDGIVKSRKSISHTKALLANLGMIADEVFGMIQTDIMRSFSRKYPNFFM